MGPLRQEPGLGSAVLEIPTLSLLAVWVSPTTAVEPAIPGSYVTGGNGCPTPSEELCQGQHDGGRIRWSPAWVVPL